MPKAIVLTEKDGELLRALLAAERKRLRNTPPRLSSERSSDEGEDHQAPEVYVAFPQEETGIPALEATDPPRPGHAKCDIYQIRIMSDGVTPELIPINEFWKIVYNPFDVPIRQDWIVVVRDKYGKWLVAATPTSESFWARLLTRSGGTYTAVRLLDPEVGQCSDSIPIDPDNPDPFNCAHINCEQHNSQGGVHPEIVRMYRSRTTTPGAEDAYFFEYSVGPHEEDSERQSIGFGSWSRNSSSVPYKGFNVYLVVVAPPVP